jgi:hypothetical protein
VRALHYSTRSISRTLYPQATAPERTKQFQDLQEDKLVQLFLDELFNRKRHEEWLSDKQAKDEERNAAKYLFARRDRGHGGGGADENFGRG